MAALGPEPDPLKVLTIAANKIRSMPFSFLGACLSSYRRRCVFYLIALCSLDTLADLACQTSPMKVKGAKHSDDAVRLGKTLSTHKVIALYVVSLKRV